MNKTNQQNLTRFQCEETRVKEEQFAVMFAEKSDVRVFFINESNAFTDGVNIIVDPAYHHAFCDYTALSAAEEFMKISHHVSQNEMLALAMLTRGQNIHECLHLLYTNFPGACTRGDTDFQKKLISFISNIIEDAYIENYAAAQFDEAWHYLRFTRIVFSISKESSQGTVNKIFEETATTWLLSFLNYAILSFIYPFYKIAAPIDIIQVHVDDTWDLFEQAIKQPIADQRDAYAYEIYLKLKPYLHEDEEFSNDLLYAIMPGHKTHDNHDSIVELHRKGKRGPDKIEAIQLSQRVMENLLDQMRKTIMFVPLIKENKISYSFDWKKLHCSPIHKEIIINENHIHYDMHDKKAYDQIVERNQYLIHNLINRLRKQLREQYEQAIEKQLFGNRINSRRFSDVKKRYWQRSQQDFRIMNLSVMILVDGSLSMANSFQKEVLNTMVILHEVFEKNHMKHCIVEHKAIYDELVVEHSILVDYEHNTNDKYSIMQYCPDENTREGITLNWAEYYIKEHIEEEQSLILVISDGMPVHHCGEASYLPPESIVDTHQSYLRLKKQGIAVIGIALGDCYDQLKQIYDHTIDCYDSSQLTKQLFRVIQRELQRLD